MIVALTLFAILMPADADAKTDAERLAEMFSPILILTEETGHKWGDIKVTKPEPVEIMGTQSAGNLRFGVFSSGTRAKSGDIDSYLNWDPPLDNNSKVSFSQNKFAFFVNGWSYQGDPPGDFARGNYFVKAYFDYPGTTPKEWNDTYFGSGARAGANHPNTAYVHIYKRVIDQYKATYNSVTVIQYNYFYPYNHWWNSHEGDWPRIDVVVSSSDPATAIILGVEYRFHSVWLNYYKDWGSKPGLTSDFVFNPRTEVKLSQGTHPVVFVGAGSHGGYPIGGEIQIYKNLTGPSGDEVQAAAGGDFEHMTHTGLVLATQAPASGSSLWERYKLQLLPEPDLNNSDNMGLVDTLSWLGARIQWGTLMAAVGGVGDKKSPYGPYDSNSEKWGASKGWGELKFFKVGKTGPNFPMLPHEMHHKNLPYKNYHHWAVIGQETLSGTVSLKGDVVVFPGATLTIKAGTTVSFPSNKDRHQFKEGKNSLSEIFVYGTLTANGTATNPISFQKSGTSGGNDAWGGVRVMKDGSVDLRHTTIRHALPPPPRNLAGQAGAGQVTLSWDAPYPVDPTITGWKYRHKAGSAAWSGWKNAGSTKDSRSVTVKTLAYGVLHRFEVRAVNASGGGPAAAVSVALMTVAYGASSYSATEGGGPVEVAVRLRPAADRAVSIPITVTAGDAEADDYTLSDLTSGQRLPFAVGDTLTCFTIEANSDEDKDQETATLGLGNALPAGVSAGTPATATLTISEPFLSISGSLPSRPASSLSTTAEVGRILVSWGPVSATPPVSGYALRYQVKGVRSSWPTTWNLCPLPTGTDTRYAHGNADMTRRYRYQVQATNLLGDSDWSQSFPANGVQPLPKKAEGLSVRQFTPLVFLITVKCLTGLQCSSSPDFDLPVFPVSGTTNPVSPVTFKVRRKSGTATWTEWELMSLKEAAGSSGAGGPAGQSSGLTATVHRVENLNDQVRHQFQVRAVNADNQAGPADSVWVIPLRSSAGDGAVTLSWDALSDTTITGWQYRFRPERGRWGTWQATSALGASTTTQRVGRLTNGVGYQFQVRAAYSGGTRAASFTASAKPAGAPLAPDSLTAQAGDRRVALRWAAADSHGAWITGYSLRDRLAKGSWSTWAAVPGGGSARDTTLTGLTNDTLYTFEVRATNRVGSGDSSRVSARPAGAPLAPDSLTAQAGDRRVALRWAAADSHGAWISGYSLRDRLAKGSWSTWAAVPGGGSARDTTLTGLTNDTLYTFEVRATNRVGSGDSSQVSARPQKLAVAGPDSVRFAENGTDTVAVYRVPSAGGSWTWSLGGADSSAFSAGDTLRFARAPDFEAPTDTDSNNVYTLQVRATPSGKGLAPLSKAVAVTVTNVNEAGAIALSPPTPRVGQTITATLSDPDTVASVQRWRWSLHIEGIGGVGGAEEAVVEAASSGLSSTYTPSVFLRGIPLEVTAFYTDRLGSGRQVQVRTAPVGAPPPPNRAPTISGVGDTTFAENGTGPVALYTGADPDGNALTWTLAGADSSAFRWQGSGLSRQLRFRAAPDYETRSTYQVTAAVSDGRASATRAVTVRVTNVDEAPVLTGPADTTWAENGTGPVATYRAADPEGDAVTWSLSGADRDTLTLSGGRLSFKTAPDYEDPADRDGNNVYAVRVRAFDGPLADSLAVTVRVRNVEEAGAVSLSSSRPQQDTLLTATLSDPDSVWASTVGWQWHRLSSRSAAGTSIGSATAASYTPQAADVGRWLVAQASYTDGHGAGKSAVDTTAAAVAGPPGPPKSLTAAAGNKQVALRWAAADSHGARISAYSLRDSLAKDSWSTWAVVPGGGSARDTTLTGLTNDTLYTFEVRATNRLGTGGTARVSATPQAAPEPPDTLTATAGNRQVTLKWTYTGTVTVTHWQYRRESDLQGFSEGQQSSTKIWGPWTKVSGDTTRSHTVTGLSNGSEYGFEVRGVNGDVPGASSNKATATPQAAPPPKTAPPAATLSASAGNKQVALSWTYTSDVTVTGWQQRHKAGSKTWGSWTNVSGSSGSTRRGTVTGLTNDTLYTFEVRGVNGDVDGTASNQVTATPRGDIPPPVLSATAGNGQVTLNWTYTGKGPVTGWKYRRQSEFEDLSGGQQSSTKIWGPWTKVPSGSGSTRSYTVTRLTNGSEYGFEVRGVNGGVDGGISNKVTATPKAPPPAKRVPPAATLSATAGNGQVALSWTYSSTVPVTGWQQHHKAGSKTWGPWANVSGGGSTRSGTVTGLTNDTLYTFEVRGVNVNGNGTASNQATATPQEPPPPAPTLSASAGNGQVALSWTYSGSVTVTHWQYRRQSEFEDLSGQRKSSTKIWGPWTKVSGGATRSHTVTQLTNGSEYGFELRGVNGSVNGSVSNKVTATPKVPVPPAPTLSATAGNRQVALSWTYSGSVTVTGWKYRRQSEFEDLSGQRKSSTKIWGPWTAISGAATRSHTVTGLTNGSEYGFELRGVNGSVNGSVSNKVTATPKAPPKAPGAPRSLSATPGNQRVSLSWSAAAANGSAILRYEYRRDSGSWSTVSGGASARSRTVTGLTNGTSYTFKVRAVNGKGAGSVASVTATPKAPPKAPGAPGSLSAAAGNKQVSLSWSAAAANGSAILRYEYRRDSGSWSTVSGGASARSRTVTGLTNGTSYTFKVRAVNGVGSGSSASVTATPKAPATVPGAPGSLSATPGIGQVSLSWSAAAANGSAILRYESHHSGGWSTAPGGASARSRTITNLFGGISYTFLVRAVNGVGNGSSASVTATPKEDFALGLNQPNPFNPETTLGYALPRAQPVRLTIYDMLGRPVRVLVDGEQPPGQHRVVWDGRDRQGRAVASGVYFYRLQTPLFSQTRKMILLR